MFPNQALLCRTRWIWFAVTYPIRMILHCCSIDCFSQKCLKWFNSLWLLHLCVCFPVNILMKDVLARYSAQWKAQTLVSSRRIAIEQNLGNAVMNSDWCASTSCQAWPTFDSHDDNIYICWHEPISTTKFRASCFLCTATLCMLFLWHASSPLCLLFFCMHRGSWLVVWDCSLSRVFTLRCFSCQFRWQWTIACFH